MELHLRVIMRGTKLLLLRCSFLTFLEFLSPGLLDISVLELSWNLFSLLSVFFEKCFFFCESTILSFGRQVFFFFYSVKYSLSYFEVRRWTWSCTFSGVLASTLSMAASAPSVGGCGEEGFQEWKNTLEFSREEDTQTDLGGPPQALTIQ